MGGGAYGELLQEVLPFQLELPGRHHDPGSVQDARVQALRDPLLVEPVPPPGRLLAHAVEVGADGGSGPGMLLEALELRVRRIAPGAAEEHRLCQEGLAPAGDEALPVEQGRVKGPEPHGAGPPSPKAVGLKVAVHADDGQHFASQAIFKHMTQ